MTHKVDWRAFESIQKQPWETAAFNPNGHAKSEKIAVLIAQNDNHVAACVGGLKQFAPDAKVVEVEAPDGKDNAKHLRALVGVLLDAIGEMPLRPGMETAMLARLPKLMFPIVDFLIIHHAERLERVCLDVVRRDRNMPPTILISRDNCFEETILNYPALLENVVFL